MLRIMKMAVAIIIFFISFGFCADLFLHKGHPITFDGPTHLTAIAQFYDSLQKGEFPVRWSNNYANYGMPLPLITHQTIAYAGAIFYTITRSVDVAYNLIIFISTFLASFFYYKFLKVYVSKTSALLGTALFTFSPYRILSVYSRGALPEYIALLFIPLLLYSFYQISMGRTKYLVAAILAVALMVLTHPMVLLMSGVILVPYWLYTGFSHRLDLRKIIIYPVIIYSIGLLISSYYFLPLMLEQKYFYYGGATPHLRISGFLSLERYINPLWYDLKDGFHPGPRAHYIKFGLVETLILIGEVLYTIWLFIKKKRWLEMSLVSVISIVLVYLTLPMSRFLYEKIELLDGIQMPYRFMSILLFIPPLLLALLANRFKKVWLTVMLIVILVFIRFSQAYGLNYVSYDEKNYFFTKANLHGEILNTIWTGNTQSYPIREEQAKIIEGEGEIVRSFIRNSSREYVIEAKSEVRLVDYTFYFPGWQLLIDGKPSEIEFQDPNYRGVITYKVPVGTHKVVLQYTQTKTRKLGDYLSILGLGLLVGVGVYIMFKRKYEYRSKK